MFSVPYAYLFFFFLILSSFMFSIASPQNEFFFFFFLLFFHRTPLFHSIIIYIYLLFYFVFYSFFLSHFVFPYISPSFFFFFKKKQNNYILMPAKGRRSAARTRPEYLTRRALRCHSKYTIAKNLHNFFHAAPIPNFSGHLLEAYVKAILPLFDSKPDLALKLASRDGLHKNNTTAPVRTVANTNQNISRKTKSKGGHHHAAPPNNKGDWINIDQSKYLKPL